MNSLVNRYIVLSALVVLLCVHLGLVIWTLVRFTQIEHWSPGIQFFGNDIAQIRGLNKSAVNNLQEGIWFHMVKVREDGGLTVRQIAADSPAEEAGLRSGDLIVSVNGTDLRLHPQAYFQARLRSSPGDRFELAWIRDGQLHSGVLVLQSTDRVLYAVEVNQQELVLGVEGMAWLQRGHFLIFPIVLLCFGTWMGYRRPHHPVAFQCALLFLATALSTTPSFLPMMSGWPLWVMNLSIGYVVFAALLKWFLIINILAVFPIETALGTWVRRHAGLILIPILVLGLSSFVHVLGLTNGWDNVLVRSVRLVLESVPESTLPVLIVIVAAILLLAQRSTARRQQRIRLHVIEIGFVLALVLAPMWVIVRPGTLMASWELLPVQGPGLPVLVWLLDHIVYVGMKCALPLTFAYAILTHRIFGLRFVFGRSLRYLVNTQGVYLVLGFCLFVVLYEIMSGWQFGMNVSDMLVASAAAGLVLILIGGWSWVRVYVIRFMDSHFFRDALEFRERLIRFQRTLSDYHDPDTLLSDTGSELLEVLDLSCAAIYLDSDTSDSISVRWHGVKDSPGPNPSTEDGLAEATEKIERILGKASPTGTLLEREADDADQGIGDAGFELIVALRGKNGLRGCIALGSKRSEEPFSGEEKEQLLVLASELELALKNIEMSYSLRKQTQGLRRLSQRLINVQESERSRLAKDLHDDTGQALTALKINLELTRKELSGVAGHAEERLSDAVDLTDETLNKLRRIAHGLRPPALDTIGLNAALDELCRHFSQHTQVSIEYRGKETPQITNPVDISLYRILQEGLTNSVRHGHATHIKVELETNNGTVKLSIQDDGKGFDADNMESNDEPGYGLMDVRERLESLEGRLEVHSSPDSGTRLVASIPLEGR